MVLKPTSVAYPRRDFPRLTSSGIHNNRVGWGSVSLFYTWRHGDSQRLLLHRVLALGHGGPRGQPHRGVGPSASRKASIPRGPALLSTVSEMWFILKPLIVRCFLGLSLLRGGRGSRRLCGATAVSLPGGASCPFFLESLTWVSLVLAIHKRSENDMKRHEEAAAL